MPPDICVCVCIYVNVDTIPYLQGWAPLTSSYWGEYNEMNGINWFSLKHRNLFTCIAELPPQIE